MSEVRVPEAQGLHVGEGGDLIVPGVEGRQCLADGAALRSVTGLSGPPPGGAAFDETMRWVVDAHPDVSVELTRVAAAPKPFRKGLIRAPLRELVYGLSVAAGIACLITVKVAVSPAQKEARDEESEIVRAMLAAPVVTYENAPAPVVAVAPLEEPTGPVAVAAGDRGTSVDEEDTTETDIPPPVVTQTEPEAEPVPTKAPAKKKRRRKRGKKKKNPREESRALLAVLGTSSDSEGTVFDVLSSSENTIGGVLDNSVLEGGLVTIAPEPEPVPDETDEIAEVVTLSVGSTKSLPRSVLPSKKISGDPKGIAAVTVEPDCKATPDPKDQVDVVFVVDASGDMGQAIASLSTQVAAMDKAVGKYDRSPHYGVVAFVDSVEVRSGGAFYTDAAALERELDRLLVRAGTDRQPDGTRPNDEPTNNGLDALHAAATKFPWRSQTDTLRLVVYASGAPLGNAGASLSGTRVAHGYKAVVGALQDRSIRVASYTGSDNRPGFQAKRGGRASIPSQTAGAAFSLDRLASGRLSLRESLEDLLANPVCEQGLFD
ncbi:MAG: hypothetical protein AAF721_18550 [Myxococcota bacterium]